MQRNSLHNTSGNHNQAHRTNAITKRYLRHVHNRFLLLFIGELLWRIRVFEWSYGMLSPRYHASVNSSGCRIRPWVVYFKLRFQSHGGCGCSMYILPRRLLPTLWAVTRCFSLVLWMLIETQFWMLMHLHRLFDSSSFLCQSTPSSGGYVFHTPFDYAALGTSLSSTFY